MTRYRHSENDPTDSRKNDFLKQNNIKIKNSAQGTTRTKKLNLAHRPLFADENKDDGNKLHTKIVCKKCGKICYTKRKFLFHQKTCELEISNLKQILSRINECLEAEKEHDLDTALKCVFQKNSQVIQNDPANSDRTSLEHKITSLQSTTDIVCEKCGKTWNTEPNFLLHQKDCEREILTSEQSILNTNTHTDGHHPNRAIFSKELLDPGVISSQSFSHDIQTYDKIKTPKPLAPSFKENQSKEDTVSNVLNKTRKLSSSKNCSPRNSASTILDALPEGDNNEVRTIYTDIGDHTNTTNKDKKDTMSTVVDKSILLSSSKHSSARKPTSTVPNVFLKDKIIKRGRRKHINISENTKKMSRASGKEKFVPHTNQSKRDTVSNVLDKTIKLSSSKNSFARNTKSTVPNSVSKDKIIKRGRRKDISIGENVKKISRASDQSKVDTVSNVMDKTKKLSSSKNSSAKNFKSTILSTLPYCDKISEVRTKRNNIGDETDMTNKNKEDTMSNVLNKTRKLSSSKNSSTRNSSSTILNALPKGDNINEVRTIHTDIGDHTDMTNKDKEDTMLNVLNKTRKLSSSKNCSPRNSASRILNALPEGDNNEVRTIYTDIGDPTDTTNKDKKDTMSTVVDKSILLSSSKNSSARKPTSTVSNVFLKNKIIKRGRRKRIGISESTKKMSRASGTEKFVSHTNQSKEDIVSNVVDKTIKLSSSKNSSTKNSKSTILNALPKADNIKEVRTKHNNIGDDTDTTNKDKEDALSNVLNKTRKSSSSKNSSTKNSSSTILNALPKGDIISEVIDENTEKFVPNDNQNEEDTMSNNVVDDTVMLRSLKNCSARNTTTSTAPNTPPNGDIVNEVKRKRVDICKLSKASVIEKFVACTNQSKKGTVSNVVDKTIPICPLYNSCVRNSRTTILNTLPKSDEVRRNHDKICENTENIKKASITEKFVSYTNQKKEGTLSNVLDKKTLLRASKNCSARSSTPEILNSHPKGDIINEVKRKQVDICENTEEIGETSITQNFVSCTNKNKEGTVSNVVDKTILLSPLNNDSVRNSTSTIPNTLPEDDIICEGRRNVDIGKNTEKISRLSVTEKFVPYTIMSTDLQKCWSNTTSISKSNEIGVLESQNNQSEASGIVTKRNENEESKQHRIRDPRRRQKVFEELKKIEMMKWCTVCRKPFANNSTLKVHLQSNAHKKEVNNVFFKHAESKTCTQKKERKRKLHNKVVKVQTKKTKGCDERNVEKVICNICEIRFPSKSSLIHHFKTNMHITAACMLLKNDEKNSL